MLSNAASALSQSSQLKHKSLCVLREGSRTMRCLCDVGETKFLFGPSGLAVDPLRGHVGHSPDESMS